jgi:hypothetical protein
VLDPAAHKALETGVFATGSGLASPLDVAALRRDE